MNTVTQAHTWLDTDLYPFESKFIQLSTGKMHYIDEGEGEPILFVHGTPTWSFLYRDYITAFSKKYRCIGIDHIGFGLSEKPADFDGRPESHSMNLTEFIRELDLKNITLVVHDFGGPIGLGAGIRDAHRIKRIVLFNSWLWKTKDDPNAEKVNRLLHSSFGKFLYLRMNISPKLLIKKGIHDKAKLSKKAHFHYIRPFPTKGSRWSLLKIGKSLLGSSDWYEQQWRELGQLEEKPWLILWGTEDRFITKQHLEKWKQRLQHAQIKCYECGHFIQEERSTETILEMEGFLKEV